MRFDSFPIDSEARRSASARGWYASVFVDVNP